MKKWLSISLCVGLALALFAGGALMATVLLTMDWDGTVIEGPKELGIYTAPSGGVEITGLPSHIGQLPRGMVTTVTYWLINEGAEPFTVNAAVRGTNVNCPDCDLTVAVVPDVVMLAAGGTQMVTFEMYPQPDTPDGTFIEWEVVWEE